MGSGVAGGTHNPLGIFNTVYRDLSIAEIAQALVREGLTRLQLDPRAPGLWGAEGPTLQRAQEVCKVLADHGITVAALAGYTNLVDPDPDRREAALQQFEAMLALCEPFGTPYIATETGSLHPQSPWLDYPANHEPEAWELLTSVLERLLKKAQAHGVTILIEGYVNNVVATTEAATRLVQELGSANLGFVLDPFNYFRPNDMKQPAAALERIFRAIGAHAQVAHAKDVVYTERGIETPRVGAGEADWPAYARLLRTHLPHVPLILEHLRPEEVAQCKALVEAAFAASAASAQT
jgi:L-ribulose-5-phosphate 3-epimerase